MMEAGGQMSFPLKACPVAIRELTLRERPMAYQLVGEVRAHQGDDE